MCRARLQRDLKKRKGKIQTLNFWKTILWVLPDPVTQCPAPRLLVRWLRAKTWPGTLQIMLWLPSLVVSYSRERKLSCQHVNQGKLCLSASLTKCHTGAHNSWGTSRSAGSSRGLFTYSPRGMSPEVPAESRREPGNSQDCRETLVKHPADFKAQPQALQVDWTLWEAHVFPLL